MGNNPPHELPIGILKAIEALENQRALLGDTVVNQAINALCNSAGVRALETDSGALAIGDQAMAIGQDGMLVNSPVGGDAMGPHSTKVEIQIGEKVTDPVILRRAYLHRVMDSAGYLSLAGIDPEVAIKAESRLSLGAVYTALLTRSSEVIQAGGGTFEWEENHLSALDMANRYDRLVLLGDPGSGKSTFVNFLALCLAGEALDDPIANLALLTAALPTNGGDPQRQSKTAPQSWDHGPLIPVRVILRDFAARGLPDPGTPASAAHLWDFIAAGLQAASLDDYVSYLHEALHKEGGLLLLDGLDEVPEAGKRRLQLKQAVEDFASTFHNCRILLTCRTYAYERQDWKLEGFHDTRLADFNRGQITRFVERWYRHITAIRGQSEEDAEGKAELLKRAIFNSDRLLSLAERPLLLTLMASLHAWRGGSLPEQREQLYSDTVDLLLNNWESPKIVRDAQGQMIVAQPSLSEWLKVDRARVRGLLNELAYQSHTAQPELVGTADMTEGVLLGGLLRLSQNPEAKANPALLVDYLSERAGLIIPRGVGVYTFPHRTFQEYLAACYLTDAEHGYPDRVAELALNDPTRWREVAMLAGAKAARGGMFALWALVDCLCPYPPEENTLRNKDSWGALLAGQALVETVNLDQVGEYNQQKIERVRRWLVHILQHNSLPAIECANAGNYLAHLGDPRFDPQYWYLPKEPLSGFIEIPSGEFWMGTDSERDRPTYDENPRHRVHLPGYYLARYPVTVAQFRAFLMHSGYTPMDRNSSEGLSNLPIVRISWFDALAYCHWIGEQLLGEAQKRIQAGNKESFWQRLASGDLRVSLPSEAEWEKAARGQDGRIYPWGDQLDFTRANSLETGIGSTSSVGCFPNGATPYGVQDMSGNVWEWTRSLWGTDWEEPAYEYPYNIEDGREALNATEDVLRVLRGGSFGDSYNNMRCASRYRGRPFGKSDYLSFRVVVSPFDLGR